MNNDRRASVNPFASDVYALAILMWELWFNAKPFGNQSVSRRATLLYCEIMLMSSEGVFLPLPHDCLSHPFASQPRKVCEHVVPGRRLPLAQLLSSPAPPPPLKELITQCWAQWTADRPQAHQILSMCVTRS